MSTERYMWRYCVHCGREFPTRYAAAMYCSHKCNVSAWRARAMLAGTHGWINRQFKRLPNAS